MQGALAKGFFIGGAVGVAVAAAVVHFKVPEDVVVSEEETDFSVYKHLNMDGALVAN